MAFDKKAFAKTEVSRRTAEVEVPELSIFFGKDEKPVFIVQNLDAPEIAKVEVSGQSNEKMVMLVSHLFAGTEPEKIKAIKELAGINEGLEPGYIQCLTRIELGSTEPKLNRQEAKRIGKISQEAFYRINRKIKELSGQGSALGKLPASMKTPKSKTV